MKPRNRRGRPVDPVPFLVVAALSFLLSFSFGPGYLRALGLSFGASLALSGAAFVSGTAVGYYRLVWTARPEFRDEVPASGRLVRLFYAILALFGVFALLTLLLVWREGVPDSFF